jgi:hypothetical protein
MDKDGNLSQKDKIKLAKFLLFAKTWWLSNPTVSDTLELIESFEDFRKSIEE